MNLEEVKKGLPIWLQKGARFKELVLERNRPESEQHDVRLDWTIIPRSVWPLGHKKEVHFRVVVGTDEDAQELKEYFGLNLEELQFDSSVVMNLDEAKRAISRAFVHVEGLGELVFRLAPRDPGAEKDGVTLEYYEVQRNSRLRTQRHKVLRVTSNTAASMLELMDYFNTDSYSEDDVYENPAANP